MPGSTSWRLFLSCRAVRAEAARGGTARTCAMSFQMFIEAQLRVASVFALSAISAGKAGGCGCRLLQQG